MPSTVSNRSMLFQLAGTYLQDATVAIRGFRRNRRFAFSALTAIVLAVGGATAVFSFIDRSMFRPLPYRDGDRLVSIGIVAPLISTQDWLFAGTYQDWRDQQTIFGRITSWSGVVECDASPDAGSPRRLGCARVEASFLTTLGVEPLLGRNFSVGEDLPGAEPVAIITHALWRSAFGADPNVLARRMTLDGVSTRLIGVLPAGFETPSLAPADLLVTQKLKRESEKQRLVRAIGRLHPGSSVDAASAALAPFFELFEQTIPADIRRTMAFRWRVATLREQQTREYRLGLWMLLGSVVAFVLIACSNVANLLLARSAARRQEFAVRAAHGASKARLVQQTLIESAVLGLAGGAMGYGFAFVLLRGLIALAPDGMLRLRQATIDSRVLAFTCALSLIAALLFGLAPAFERLRTETFLTARTAGHRRSALRPVLIVVQLSVSLVLLTGAGMLLTSLWRLSNASLGFGQEHVVTATFVLPSFRYSNDTRQLEFFRQLEEQLTTMPGAAAAAITDSLPPGGDPRSRPFVALRNPGGNAAAQGMGGLVKWRYVTPQYFATLDIPIVRGRPFNQADRAPGEQQAILSESLARGLFGEEDPIGKRIPLEAPMVVVGVAGEVRNAGLGRVADPEFYVVRKNAPNEVFRNQRPPNGWRQATAIVRSSLPTSLAADLLKSAIGRVDPALPVDIENMETQVDRFLTRPRFQTAMLALFAAVGLALAGIGLFGLISFLVADRTREIGVRMALGATAQGITRMVISDGLCWTAGGAVAGTAVSVLLLRLMEGMLYGVTALDARIYLAATAILFGTSLVATWLPSRRAARVDPMAALRHD